MSALHYVLVGIFGAALGVIVTNITEIKNMKRAVAVMISVLICGVVFALTAAFYVEGEMHEFTIKSIDKESKVAVIVYDDTEYYKDFSDCEYEYKDKNPGDIVRDCLDGVSRKKS
jgi:hypothetical protein